MVKVQSEETKRKLIRATKALIAKKGWGALSNRAIADQAGVNLALISYHFGSQSGLLAAAVDDAVASLSVRMQEMPSAASLADFALSAIASVPAMGQDIDSRVLAIAMLEATYDEEVAGAVVRNLRSFRNALVQIAGPEEPSNSGGQAILIAALLDGLLLHLLVDPTTDIRGAAKALKKLLESC